MSSAPPKPAAPEEVLQTAAQMLAPLVRLLMHHGIDHPRFAAAMKRVFVDVALQDLPVAPPPTHTAVGLLTGLQRRDVKALREAGGARWPAKALSPSLPMQLVARWANLPETTDDQGRPRPLPMRKKPAAPSAAASVEVPAVAKKAASKAAGGEGTAPAPEVPSFEQLAAAVSKDMHPGALLAELVRLGLARDDDGLVTLLNPDFVPARDAPQLLGAMARNTHDHLAAAVANLLAGKPKFLEYSLVADELTAESAEALHELARKTWSAGYRKSVVAATEHVARDKAEGFSASRPEVRVRFGAYFYSEPVQRDGDPR